MRSLTRNEISILEAQSCRAEDWSKVMVADDFSTEYVNSAQFSGNVTIGAFEKWFELPGGMRKHSGLDHVTLHNVSVGDNCCIENVKNYIANCDIENDVFIENVDIILVDGLSSFGNGVSVSVLSETGGKEVIMHDNLSAQQAYMMAICRDRLGMFNRINELVADYSKRISSTKMVIGHHSKLVDTGYVKNVKIGPYTEIEGASRLKNGSINSNQDAPVHIGVGVIADGFIISSGADVEEGVMLTRCFVGQACKLGHGYSASDSLFFANCQGENGEACAIFAGPFTVTHHKSSLLIAGMFSFMNAGSGSNQSNHMYKLGPVHFGRLERGAKTASDSYILWPARVGAFSLVMGRHTNHQDTSSLPFSYLIERENTTYIMPGANLKSVGTIRDARKWPLRDARKDPHKIDLINFNLLSPYTVQKMLAGMEVLENLEKVSGDNTQQYVYQNGVIKKSSLKKGLKYYSLALDKFLGNSVVSRFSKSGCRNIGEARAAFKPTSDRGQGVWKDVAGLIAPETELTRLYEDVENGLLKDIADVSVRFREMYDNYYDYEWTWAYDVIRKVYGIELVNVSTAELKGLVDRWLESVIVIDKMLLDDAAKELRLCERTDFDTDPFVVSIKDHIVAKTALHDDMIKVLDSFRD